MTYSKGLVLYQDKPDYGLSIKLIFAVVAAGLLTSAFYLFSTGEAEAGQVLLLELFIIILILFGVTPRAYRIYEDRIRIVMGGPFSINIPFDKIKSVEIPGKFKMTFGVNFTTRMTGKYVAIVPKKGPAISITPNDSELFVENAYLALNEWAKTKG